MGWEDLLEKEMVTHSSILARKSPWTDEPGGLQSKGSSTTKPAGTVIVLGRNSYCTLSSHSYLNFGDRSLRPSWIITTFAPPWLSERMLGGKGPTPASFWIQALALHSRFLTFFALPLHFQVLLPLGEKSVGEYSNLEIC